MQGKEIGRGRSRTFQMKVTIEYDNKINKKMF